MFLASDGKCEGDGCGIDLRRSWHGDHVMAYTAGGPTDVKNGQTLCPSCNLKKGSKMTYLDIFRPRQFQNELINVVKARMSEGRNFTVVWVGPGGGKTLGYQAVANQLLRSGAIDTAAIYAPRSSLAAQCELEYKSDRNLFDASRRFRDFLHNINTPPFTEGADVGFVSTYAALTTQPNIHLQWAREHAGRFLLVVDEAQFCGCDDADRAVAGTAAAANIEAISKYAAHTLILTGTPYRSDKSQIVLADYRFDDQGRKFIDWHVRSGYADGIEQNYLRQFESRLIEAHVTRRNVDKDSTELSLLSDDSRQLGEIIKCEEVWQEVVDKTVSELNDAKEQWHGYKALIACMEQAEARKVARYLQSRYPHRTVALALSNDGADAQKALRDFRKDGDGTDILVTVRMAFVGYDCKGITVIGCLTNYRDKGHLEQLIGRGLRVDDQSGISPDRQRCRIIAPDDMGMQSFIEYLRREQEKGITPPGPGGNQPPEQVEYVESATATSTRVISMDSELGPAAVSVIDEVRSQFGVFGSVTEIVKLVDRLQPGFMSSLQATPATPRRDIQRSTTDVVVTDRERVAMLRSDANRVINSTLAAVDKKCNFNPPADEYSKSAAKMRRAKFRKAINKKFGIRSVDEIRTVERAEQYLAHCRIYCERKRIESGVE